jgi:hypothetical protein
MCLETLETKGVCFEDLDAGRVWNGRDLCCYGVNSTQVRGLKRRGR